MAFLAFEVVNLYGTKGTSSSLVLPRVACRTGVIFCVFQANRGESEARARQARGKRELRARGGALKNPACPHTIVQAVPAFKYERGSLIGYFETRDPRMFFQDVTQSRTVI